MSPKSLQVKNTCTTISILFGIFFLIDQLNLLNYAIDISNWNFKMSGIGSSSTLHIGGMNFTQNNNNNNQRKLFLTIFLNNLTKINNKHNDLDTASLTEYLLSTLGHFQANFGSSNLMLFYSPGLMKFSTKKRKPLQSSILFVCLVCV